MLSIIGWTVVGLGIGWKYLSSPVDVVGSLCEVVGGLAVGGGLSAGEGGVGACEIGTRNLLMSFGPGSS